MIIKDLMEYIWRDVAEQYKVQFERYSKYESDRLYNELIRDIPYMDKGVSSPYFVENILPTCGCTHRHQNGKLAGCSMCDWESKNIKQCAKMAALRKKDKKLYGDIIVKSIEINRGKNIKPALIEELATHDLLDENDFTEEAFDKIFVTNQLFTSRPMVGLMAARPSSITKDKIKKWKSQYRKSIIVGIGIETGSEFLRNHWINKNTQNKTILEALNILEEEGAESSGDILLGLPGLPAGHAIQIFKETLIWLNKTNIGTILVSPLSRKDKTLQEFIYRTLFLKGKTLDFYEGEKYYTDIPSVYTILQALCEAIEEIPGIENKIKISPQNTNTYLKQISKEGKKQELTNLEAETLNLIEEMSKNNMYDIGINTKSLFRLLERVKTDDQFKRNKEKILREQEVNLKVILTKLVESAVLEIWPDEVETKVSEFKKEIMENYDR